MSSSTPRQPQPSRCGCAWLRRDGGEDVAMTELTPGLSSLKDPLVWHVAVFAILIAFALGQVVAAVYMATFRGLSYSRATVHGMALGSVVACMLMLAV